MVLSGDFSLQSASNPQVCCARLAMATRFEIVLHGDNPAALRAAGEEALDEIARLEDQLSLYRAGTELSRVNARAAKEPVQVTPSLFALLELAKELNHETGGAFDISVAPLVRCWGFMGEGGSVPEPAQLEEARTRTGMDLVELHDATKTVRFAREGVLLDLGAIGKGYAVDQAVEVLRESGVVQSALVHGGTSTVYGLGAPPGAVAWRIAVRRPPQVNRPLKTVQDGSWDNSDEEGVLRTVCLRDEALSVSAVWGKFFQAEGKMYGHVLDPRTGEPTTAAQLAAVVLTSATETDALSTALLIAGEQGYKSISALRPKMRTLLAI